MKYEILKEGERIKVEITLPKFNQPDKSIQELEKMGIFKEIADTSKVRDLLSKDGYVLGEGTGPKISNFSNGFITTGIYEFENLDPSRPKPARKSAPRKDDEVPTLKKELVPEKTIETPVPQLKPEPKLSNEEPVSTTTSQKNKQPKTMKRRSNN